MTGNGSESGQKLRPISPLWALGWVVALPLVFPPELIMYGGIAFGGAVPRVGFLLAVLSLGYVLDRDTRGRINDNIRRTRSALAAREAAASGQEPAALLLHSFTEQSAYRDEFFSLYESVDPALRFLGFPPLAFGTVLPLAPDHGVALISTSDEAWWESFRQAARDAAVILVSPQGTASLRREVAWLPEQGLTDKLVILMAPEPLDVPRETGDPNMTYSEPAGPVEGRKTGWVEARQAWRDRLGVELPEYDPRGALIVASGTGGRPWSRPLRAFAKEPFDRRMIRIGVGALTGHYDTGAGIDLGPPLREAYGLYCWSGPPVSALWQRLAPPPLDIGPRPMFDPPGASGGAVGEYCSLLAILGWGLALLVGLLLALS